MDKLKLLFVTRNDRNYTVPATHYFVEALRKTTDLHVSHAAGRIGDIVGALDFKPDFVYFHDYLENGSPVVTGLKELDVPYAVCLHDLHYMHPRRKQILLDEGVRHVFTYYRDRFIKWYPEFADNMRWMPHHANTDVFRDYGTDRDIDLLVTGALIEPYYPLRGAIVRRLAGRPEFVHLPHPGYRQIGAEEEGVWVGSKYATMLSRAKICLTCDSIFHYPLMKYYEIAASNCLLLAPFSQELHDLGFVPGVNFVSIDEHNFEEKAYYYLHHEDDRKLIALNGMHMVRRRHSTEKRASEFLAAIREILAAEAG